MEESRSIFKNKYTHRQVRDDFPILNRKIKTPDNNSMMPLVYLDNAATTQKPIQVINAVREYYETTNANVHRALHTLGEQATEMYENSRETVREFIGAESTSEIIFTRNTTESINLIAYSWGNKNVKAGDEILLSEMEHHSNIIPWQLLAERTGCVLKFIPFNENGTLDMEAFKSLLNEKRCLSE